MGIARDEFYKKLQDDYKESGSASTIYQYISKEHTRLVQQAIDNSTCSSASVKKSNILQIKLHWEMLLLDKETSEQYISHLLHILKNRPVLYQDTTDSTSVEFLIDFISVGLNLDSTARTILMQSKVKRKIHDRLIELVDNMDSKDKNIQNNIWLHFKQSKYTQKPYAELSKITKIIIDRATNVEIKAFFYDAGYPLTGSLNKAIYNSSDESLVKKNVLSKRVPRVKIDKTLNLMDIFCEKKNYSLFSINSYPSNSDCEKMFSLLVHSKNHEVLIPLRVDAQTGCSLYIIGRKYYECLYIGNENSIKSRNFKNNPAACSYGILELNNPFHDISNNKQTFSNLYLDHSVGYMLLNDFGQYNSFDVAEFDYNEYCRDCLDELIEKNNLKLPKDCPSFFYQYSLLRKPTITVEEYNETKHELYEDFEDFKKNMANLYGDRI